jgi:hypothetical protein
LFLIRDREKETDWRDKAVETLETEGKRKKGTDQREEIAQ